MLTESKYPKIYNCLPGLWFQELQTISLNNTRRVETQFSEHQHTTYKVYFLFDLLVDLGMSSC